MDGPRTSRHGRRMRAQAIRHRRSVLAAVALVAFASGWTANVIVTDPRAQPAPAVTTEPNEGDTP